MKPIQDDVDELFQYYFRCNFILANEGTFFIEDCIPAVDLSDKSYFPSIRDRVHRNENFVEIISV